MKKANPPQRLYHGTNIVAAVRILDSGRIEATTPVDGDEPVVCTTALRAVARCFAVEFARENSSHEVGVVFAINSSGLATETAIEGIHAETASFDEREFRIVDDIGVGHVIAFQCVGATGKLKSKRYLEDLHEANCADIPWNRFSEIVRNLADRQAGSLKAFVGKSPRP